MTAADEVSTTRHPQKETPRLPPWVLPVSLFVL